MKLASTLRHGLALLLAALGLLGCHDSSVSGAPGVPEPLKVLENPKTGERVRFYREIWYKRPRGYDERKHLADWTATERSAGFTQEVSREVDRARLAELRASHQTPDIQHAPAAEERTEKHRGPAR